MWQAAAACQGRRAQALVQAARRCGSTCAAGQEVQAWRVRGLGWSTARGASDVAARRAERRVRAHVCVYARAGGGARGLGRRGGGERRARERGRRPGYGVAPQRVGREGEGPAGVHVREGEREGKGKKRKGKENGKEKWRKKKRGRERDPRRDHGADRGAGRPRLAPGRARARCAGRGKNRDGTAGDLDVSSVPWGIRKSGGR